MKVFLIFTTILAIPVWAQDPAAEVQPDLQQMEVEPTFVDGSPEVEVKPQGVVEKAKNKVLQSYEDWRQKSEQEKAEAEKPQSLLGKIFAPRSKHVRVLVGLGWTGVLLFAFIVVTWLTTFLKAVAFAIGQFLTPTIKEDDRAFQLVATGGLTVLGTLILYGIIYSVPGLGYLARQVGGGMIFLVCLALTVLIFWARGLYDLKEEQPAPQPQQQQQQQGQGRRGGGQGG